MLTYQPSSSSNTGNFLELSRRRGRVLANRTSIYHQGDDFAGFYRVNSGVVMVFRLLEDSTRQISGFFTAGDFFGFSSGDHHNDNAVCVTTANVARLSMADVRDNADLQRAVFEATCKQIDAAQSHVTTLTRKSAEAKVAGFLLKLAETSNATSEETSINLPMNRLDIADYLGMSIETVSRRLTALKAAGIIQLPNRKTAEIKSVSRLAELAGAIH